MEDARAYSGKCHMAGCLQVKHQLRLHIVWEGALPQQQGALNK